jgi:hypothetical protein
LSVPEVERVLRTASDGGGFAAQLGSDPSILTGYDLTADERRALVGRDVEALRAMGVAEELLEAVRNVSGSSPRRI